MRCGVRTDGKVTGFAHRLHICSRKKVVKEKKKKIRILSIFVEDAAVASGGRLSVG